jgi:hypothetical protein
MPTFTPKLGLKKPLGNETVTRAAFNENWDTIDQMAAREPFLLKSAVYDSENDRIDITIGPGRADFLSVLVVQNSNTVYSIDTPTANTSYFLYLKSDGTFTHNTSGAEDADTVLIWKVVTGTTVDVTTIEDLRAELPDAGMRILKGRLDAHAAATNGVHGATSAATPNTIVQRDANSQFNVGVPTENTHIARKQDVDVVQTNLTNHIQSSVAHAASAISANGGTNVQAEIDNLKSSVSSGKNVIASAITDMGQPANGSETFAQLAGHIRDISKDANAGTVDVLSGKTFYQGGAKRTGTMPNYAGQTLDRGAGNTALVKRIENLWTGAAGLGSDLVIQVDRNGHYNDTRITQAVYGVHPDVVKAGHPIGANPSTGEPGSYMYGTFTSDANAGSGDILSGKTAYVNGNKITGNIPNVGEGTNTVSTLNDSTGGPDAALVSIEDGGGGDFAMFVAFKPPRGYYDGNSKIRLRFWGLHQNIIKAGQSIGWVNGTELKGTFTSDANAGQYDIVSGRSAYVNGNKVNGTLPDRPAYQDALSYATNGDTLYIRIPQGAYRQNGGAGTPEITLNRNAIGLVQGNIRAGATVLGVQGDAWTVWTGDVSAEDWKVLSGQTYWAYGQKRTGTMPDRRNSFVQHSWSNSNADSGVEIIPQAGYYDGSTAGVWIADENLNPNNIRAGVSIFGVNGNLVTGKRWASGSITLYNSSYTITGLDFTPSIVIDLYGYEFSFYFNGYGLSLNANGVFTESDYFIEHSGSTAGPGYFTMNVQSSSIYGQLHRWVAFE